MTKKLWITKSNEGGGANTVQTVRTVQRKMDVREVDADVYHTNHDIYMTKTWWQTDINTTNIRQKCKISTNI